MSCKHHYSLVNILKDGCMCVCICVYIHIYIDTYTYIYSVCVYIYKFIFVKLEINVIYANVYNYVGMNVFYTRNKPPVGH